MAASLKFTSQFLQRFKRNLDLLTCSTNNLFIVCNLHYSQLAQLKRINKSDRNPSVLIVNYLTCKALLCGNHEWSQAEFIHHLNNRAIFLKNASNFLQLLLGDSLMQFSSRWRLIRSTDSDRFTPSAFLPAVSVVHNSQSA